METNCPYCHELIKKAASKCKHCGEFLDSGKSLTKAGVNITINTNSNSSTTINIDRL
jgi:uncharacterized Zn finger protein